MPFRRWSLLALDLSLEVVLRYNWRQTRVTRIRFPALENQSSKPLRCSIECAVTGVEQASPTTGGAASGHANSARHADSARKDPLPNFLMKWQIDGLEGLGFNISKIDSFEIRNGGPADLVLTATPEKMADPFRSWLNSGASPRAGTLTLLNTALQPSLSLQFTGMRVRTVAPALTTDSPGPGTVHLSYSGISF
jgi:hypothetical protein